MMQVSVILAQLSWIRNALDRMPQISLAQGQALLAEVREMERTLAAAKQAESEAKEARIKDLARAGLAAETSRVVAANEAGCGSPFEEPRRPGQTRPDGSPLADGGHPGPGGVALSPVTCTQLDAAAHE